MLLQSVNPLTKDWCNFDLHVHVRSMVMSADLYRVRRWDPMEKEEDDRLAQHAYPLQDLWDPQLLLNEVPTQGEGLHCPLPHPCIRYFISNRWVERHLLMRPLFHFASYFFPLMGSASAGCYTGSAALSPSQLSAIFYVNGFLKSR